MSNEDKGQWKTHCVGRLLIDLPSDAEYVGGSYEYAFATVERQSMEHSAFRQEVDKLEAKLKEGQHKSGSSFLLAKAVPDENTQIFGYWANENRSSAIEISGYKWLQGMRYLIHKRANYEKMERAVSRMGTTISMLHTRDASPPTAPGFCVERAIFADEGRSGNESLNIRFRLTKYPDVVVDVATNLNAGDPPESLLSRKPGVLSALGVLGATLGGVRNIKEGDRKIGDYPGQEWLMKAPNDHGQQAHLFTWEAPGLHADELRPQIRIDLQSGNFDGGLDPKPISMTDQQMLQLWDKILNSLRLRPTNGAKDSTEKKPSQQSNSDVLPLGELVRTGASCPQTGYWQCPENDIQGSTRLFHAGDTMPPAIIKRDLSFVERLRGSSDQHSTGTVWRLVRYEGPNVTSMPMSPASDDTIQPPSDA
ncbi:MAG TPA: T6SS immunity protein Tli4 family protein [Pseudoduganella sp.]